MWVRTAATAAVVLCGGFGARADEPTKPVAQPVEARRPAYVEPEPTAKERVLAALRTTAEALRSRTVEPEERAAFVELLNAAEALRVDESVPQHERDKWRGMARGRLGEGVNILRRAAAPNAVQPAANAVPATTAVLAQFQPAGGGIFGGGAPNASSQSPDEIEAEKLIELITDAIRPDSWEVNGGLGSIRYWSLGHALIITNSADVHEKVGGLGAALRP